VHAELGSEMACVEREVAVAVAGNWGRCSCGCSIGAYTDADGKGSCSSPRFGIMRSMTVRGGDDKRVAERLIDATARRPGGWLGRKAYGGAAGAPKGHEAVFDQVLDIVGPLDGERCLELGCGGGRLLERVLAMGATVAAIDHSAEMIELSSARNAESLKSGALELRLGDVERLPWADGIFGVALSANSFFFFPRPERVLAEVFRVLSPGGRVVIATVPGPLPAPSLRNWWVYVWGSKMHVYDDAVMRSMLHDAGFVDIAITRRDQPQPLQLIRARR
jgi:SAM-dependent methyltransferase